MKFSLTPFSVVVAALCSVVVAFPLRPTSSPEVKPFSLEVEFASDAFGYAQIYYDIGRGFNEADSTRIATNPGETFTTIQLRLPAGTYRNLRFDPTDRTAHVRFRNVRIVGGGGKIIHSFSPSDFIGQQQIASLDVEGDSIRLITTLRAEDPMVAIRLAQPITLAAPSPPLTYLRGRSGVALQLFVALVFMLGVVSRWPNGSRERIRKRFRKVVSWLVTHPQRAVVLAAALAVAASSYPVVFLGKSFVSPNFSDGTFLLYEQVPTLPAYKSSVTESGGGSDVGAIIWQQVPYSFIQARALLRDHELPLWNRYNSCGTVLLGQGQSMFGDPLHLLVILADGASWAWDVKYLVAKWLLCCGLGLTVLHGTRHLPAAAVTTLAAAFLGFFLFRLNHPAYFSFCYAPWILYTWARISSAATWRDLGGWCAALIVANGVEMNSGTVKEAYMLLLGMNLSGVFAVLFAAKPWRAKLITLGSAVWAGVLFLLLSAPFWVTLFDALNEAYTAYDSPKAFQIHPSVALGLFDELFYRPLQRGNRVSNPSANFLVLIGLLYFLAAFRVTANSRLARGFAWSALIPLALAFGLVPPQCITKIPFLGNVAHIDNAFSCVLIILLVVLAGFGWKLVFERLGTEDGRGDLIRMAWAYVALVFPWIAFMHTVHRPTFGDSEVISLLHWGQRVEVSDFIWLSLLVLSLGALGLLLTARHALKKHRIGAAGLLFIVLAVVVLIWRNGMQSRAVGPDDFVFSPASRANFHAESAAIAALKADQREPGRAVGLGSNLFPGWSSTYGIENIAGVDALLNRYYRELVDGLGLERIWDWRIYTSADRVSLTKAALDFLNVRHYADLRSDRGQLGTVLTPLKFADLDVYRSETAWPRAFFTEGVIPYDSPQQLAEYIRDANGRPFAAVARNELAQISAAAPLVVTGSATPLKASPAHDYRLTTNSTAFTIEASRPGMAVLHEAWLKHDFRVTVNGEPTRYIRVNHAFKGVVIPSAGRYRIEFTYRPRHFSLALALSGAGLALGGITAFGIRRLRPLSGFVLAQG